MPFINSFGAASSRGYGFTRGGGGADTVIAAIRAAYSLGAASTSYSQSEGWTYVDCRNAIGTTKLITVSCGGSRGGSALNGQRAAGAGASLTGTVPTSFLAGKIIAFVNAGNPPSDSGGDARMSPGGGGFSGLIILDPASYLVGGTLTHVISAAGGGGSNGGGDNGFNIPGISATSVVTGTNLTPVGGVTTAKDPGGNVGSYPSIAFAGKNGNKYGGGDGANNSQGTDLFVNPGGGGFGPRRGVLSNGVGDPSGTSTGMSLGFPSQTPHSGQSELLKGSFGGGGCGAGSSSGGQPWRVISAGGGGGGFYGGNTGYGGTDGSAQAAGAGTSYCWNSSNLISHSGASSNTGFCNVSWTA